MRVLLPAARIIAAVSLNEPKPARPKPFLSPLKASEWPNPSDDSTHSLPGQDSNLNYQDQNLVCYQLHHRVIIRTCRVSNGSLVFEDNHTAIQSRPRHLRKGRGGGLTAEA